MKWVKKGWVVGLGLVSVLMLGACNQGKTSTSSSETVSTSTTKTKQSSSLEESTTSSNMEQTSSSESSEVTEMSMDFAQIQQGDYSSLQGSWEEVAVSLNRHDGTGNTWIEGQNEQIEISQNQIVDGNMTISGSVLHDGENKNLSFRQADGYLAADSDDGAIIWNVYFYPKGVALADWGEEIPETIDTSKERIVIRTSNNNYIQVFQKSDEAVSNLQPTASQNQMNLSEIKTGDYTSVEGSWVNARGATLEIANQRIILTDLTGYGEGGTITGLRLDMPDSNGADGQPIVEEGQGGIVSPRYNPELRVVDDAGFVTLNTTYTGALLCVSFLPERVAGDIQGGDIQQEKIVAIGTQNNATAVPADYVYYRSN